MKFLATTMMMAGFVAYGSSGTQVAYEKAKSISLIGQRVYWQASNGALLSALITEVRAIPPDSILEPAALSNLQFVVRPRADDDMGVPSAQAPRFDFQDEHAPDGIKTPTIPLVDKSNSGGELDDFDPGGTLELFLPAAVEIVEPK